MTETSIDSLWELIHSERAALADDLDGLTLEQWRRPTLCGDWDVEQVLAHLTAAASLNQLQWIRSMLGAGFRPHVHNQRRLDEQRGGFPGATLEKFRAVIDSRVAPSSDIAAFLGEVVVHAQDIRQPLGLRREPRVEALTPVAAFFASRNFAVNSRTLVKGLQLRSDDGPFTAGTGPLITGSTLALVMAMAGRSAYLDELDGPGVPILRSRIGAGVSGA